MTSTRTGAIPATVRAFGVVAVVRVLVVVVALVGTGLDYPHLVRAYQQHFDTAFHTTTTTDATPLPGLQTVLGVVSVLAGLAWVGGWAFAAWHARRGSRAGAIAVVVLSALAVAHAALTGGVAALGLPVPGWVVGLVVAQVVLEVAVVVLLTVPSSRAWYRARETPAPRRH